MCGTLQSNKSMYKKEASFANTWQPSESWLTSVGLRPDLSSLEVLGSVTLAPLSRLGVSEEGSHESLDPADPLAAGRMLTGEEETIAYVEKWLVSCMYVSIYQWGTKAEPFCRALVQLSCSPDPQQM